MILSFHICIAIAGLGIAFTLALRPSQRLFITNYVFIAMTFLSGTLLIIQQPAHMASACISGLCYLAATAALTAVAVRKFAYQTSQK